MSRIRLEAGEPPWTVVTKTQDESRTGTVKSSDAELLFASVSGWIYELRGLILYASPLGGGSPDLSVTFAEDNVERGVVVLDGFTSTDSANAAPMAIISSSSSSRGTATFDRHIDLRGILFGGGGTFSMRWAHASGGQSSPTIVRANSYIKYRRLL